MRNISVQLVNENFRSSKIVFVFHGCIFFNPYWSLNQLLCLQGCLPRGTSIINFSQPTNTTATLLSAGIYFFFIFFSVFQAFHTGTTLPTSSSLTGCSFVVCKDNLAYSVGRSLTNILRQFQEHNARIAAKQISS